MTVEDNTIIGSGVETGGRCVDALHGRRRALLIGICYEQTPDWGTLTMPHKDVDRLKGLLIGTYNYRPEDVYVMKDHESTRAGLRPTRANIIRMLHQLVRDAKAGDRFVFLFSGHCDQQIARHDLSEEDGQDEAVITCDNRKIIDNRLRKILVNNLPSGSNLMAIFDTCHSGTLLDLPHYHCNQLYVPWISRSHRTSSTLRAANKRRYEITTPIRQGSAAPLSSLTNRQTLRIDTAIIPDPYFVSLGTASETLLSASGKQNETNSPSITDITMSHWSVRSHMLPSAMHCDSPSSYLTCNGWCERMNDDNANVVSISSCTDLQTTWEGSDGSTMTAAICTYLSCHKKPSYKNLMTNINFDLHTLSLALHDWTRQQLKARATNFEGEMNVFQEPVLSSLSKLNMDDLLIL